MAARCKDPRVVILAGLVVPVVDPLDDYCYCRCGRPRPPLWGFIELSRWRVGPFAGPASLALAQASLFCGRSARKQSGSCPRLLSKQN